METVDDLLNNFKSDIAIVSSSRVIGGDYRLTPEYFKGFLSLNQRTDLTFFPLSKIAEVFYPGIFKRIYVDSIENGIPFLSSSDIMNYRPIGETFVSKELTKNINSYIVQKGWILVSRSGTIGNVALVTNEIDQTCVSEHALRVIPKESKFKGFLYTYLSSEMGQAAVKGKKSGAVIDEIYEDDLLQIPIPLIDDKPIELIDNYIEKAILLREESNELMKQADLLVYKYNNLPPLNIEEAECFDKEREIPSRILVSSNLKLDNRLDSHYYKSIFELLTQNIKKNSKKTLLLIDVCSNIFLCYRFPRNIVQANNGIPLIGTKNTMQIRPTEMKYVSKMDVENDLELIAQKNWILLARVGSLGGTFGKVAFVWANFEGFVASDNIIRIVPDASKIDSAYLFAYLNSLAGYTEIIRLRHGALQDALDVNDIKTVPVPIPNENEQKVIGDQIRLAHEKRSEAIRFEDQAQEVLKQSLAG